MVCFILAVHVIANRNTILCPVQKVFLVISQKFRFNRENLDATQYTKCYFYMPSLIWHINSISMHSAFSGSLLVASYGITLMQTEQ